MKLFNVFVLALGLTLGLATVGCKKEEPSATEKLGNAMEEAAEGAKEAAEAAGEEVEEAAEEVKDAVK